MKESVFIIKVGGSIVFPKRETINLSYLSEFKQMLLRQINKGRRFILIVGGGYISRWYQTYARESLGITSEDDLHKIGAATTRTNAEVIRSFFGDLAYTENYTDFTKHIEWTQPILVSSAWIPGKSTDLDAVLLAEKFNVHTVIINSNVDYIYSRDPKKDVEAEPIKQLSWAEYELLIGDYVNLKKHTPGANIPIDVIAMQEAKRLGLRAVFVNGIHVINTENLLDGKEFIGTTVNG